MQIAKNIVRNRKKLKMTQSYVAEKIGVSRQSVSLYEIDKAIPSLEVVIRIANLFNISLDELVFSNSDTKLTKDNRTE